jgi:DNA-binding MarR family transcriptional regulator
LKTDYSKTVQLMQAWHQYAQAVPEATLGGFGEWLVQHQRLATSVTEIPHSPGAPVMHEQRPSLEPHGSFQEQMLTFFQQYQAPQQIAVLINRISRLLRLYAKKALEPLGVDLTLEEWTMLVGVRKSASMRMSDAISMSVLGSTTGSEMLRRLKRDGYVEEFPNPADRRSKLVRLTAKGQRVLETTYGAMLQIGEHLCSVLPTAEQHQLAQLLGKLHNVHIRVFMKASDADLQGMLAALREEMAHLHSVKGH